MCALKSIYDDCGGGAEGGVAINKHGKSRMYWKRMIEKM